MIDSNSQAIIDAINSGNSESAKRMDRQQSTLEAQQDSISQLAKSVHELAMTTSYLQKNIDSNEQRFEKEIDSVKKIQNKELNIIHARIDKAQVEGEKKLDNIHSEIKGMSKRIDDADKFVAVSDVKVSSLWLISQRAIYVIVGVLVFGSLAGYIFLGKP
jgi:predicted RNase H-like nuclease (RuvC/YqgF family)